ncbi:MAG: Calx-beta domain-containing protein [Bacillota bacterium]
MAIIEGTSGAVSGEFSGTYAIDAGIFSLSLAGYEVAENAGSVTITVYRDGLSGSSVEVSYTTENGTAVAPGTVTVNWP